MLVVKMVFFIKFQRNTVTLSEDGVTIVVKWV